MGTFLFPMGAIGAIVFLLYPLDELDDISNIEYFHGQCHTDEQFKLRHRNGWSFFPPT